MGIKTYSGLDSGASIGGAIVSGTTGSVLFVGAGSTLAQDNANFFWDDTNNRLGIGIAAPLYPLHVNGRIKIPDSTTNTAGLYIGDGNDLQIYHDGGSSYLDNVNGALLFFQRGTSIGFYTASTIRQTLNATGHGFLTNAPTHTLTLASTTTGYAHYNTADQVTNYERIALKWDSNFAYLSTEKAGSGAGRSFIFNSAGALYFYSTGLNRWEISGDGHFLASTDNTFDIGASGATRPRTIYAGSNIYAGNTSFAVQFAANSVVVLTGQSDGVATLYNITATNFSRLQFGGTTSSFPSLKRSTTMLQARLADDSDFAPLQGILRVHANAAAEVVVATHTMRVFDAAGTEYKVLCIAA